MLQKRFDTSLYLDWLFYLLSDMIDIETSFSLYWYKGCCSLLLYAGRCCYIGGRIRWEVWCHQCGTFELFSQLKCFCLQIEYIYQRPRLGFMKKEKTFFLCSCKSFIKTLDKIRSEPKSLINQTLKYSNILKRLQLLK